MSVIDWESEKRSVRCIFNREMRENRESLCSLFLLVRAVRVVRGSCFSTGVSVVGEGEKRECP